VLPKSLAKGSSNLKSAILAVKTCTKKQKQIEAA